MSRIAALFCTMTIPLALWAQGFVGLAGVDVARAKLIDTNDGVEMVLPLSQPVPFRVFTLADPWRVVLDFSEVDWRGVGADLDRSAEVEEIRTGAFAPGWSRMVLELRQPMRVAKAAMQTEGQIGAVLDLRLETQDEASFRASAGAPVAARFQLPEAAVIPVEPQKRQVGDAPLVVVIDPGHGGVDPGAEREGQVEADLMLAFALELEEALLRAGNFDVIMTRRVDQFVPLEARVSIARAAGADVFLSLHADALAEGRASGATIYTLSDTASDVASQKLAERHDREDLLAGVDLSQQDDVIAGVLMDLARVETTPRSSRLADDLVAGLKATVGGLHKRPRLEAGFSVLKAPDIPSVLVELGFLSSDRDRANLTNADWRKSAAEGIVSGLRAWAAADAAEALLIRQ